MLGSSWKPQLVNSPIGFIRGAEIYYRRFPVLQVEKEKNLNCKVKCHLIICPELLNTQCKLLMTE